MTVPQRALLVTLRGRVQGVGFRFRVAEIAAGHPVTGSVRNVRDDTLEIAVEGEPQALERFIAAVLAAPPRGARVDAVEREEVPLGGRRSFEVAPSV